MRTIRKNWKKILFGMIYVFGTLTLGIIAYQLNAKRRAVEAPEYLRAKDPQASTSDFQGSVTFELDPEIFFPETLPIYRKDTGYDLNIEEKLDLSLTDDRENYQKWENAEWTYVVEENTGSYRLRNKKITGGVITSEISEVELRTTADSFINDTLGLDLSLTDFSKTVAKRYDNYSVEYSKKLRNLSLIQETEPENLIEINISPAGKVFFISINHPEILTAAESDEARLLTLDELKQIKKIDIINLADVYISIGESPALNILEEANLEHLHPNEVSDDLFETTITKAELVYQVKISTEESLILPVFKLEGSARTVRDYEGYVTIIYPAVRR